MNHLTHAWSVRVATSATSSARTLARVVERRRVAEGLVCRREGSDRALAALSSGGMTSGAAAPPAGTAKGPAQVLCKLGHS